MSKISFGVRRERSILSTLRCAVVVRNAVVGGNTKADGAGAGCVLEKDAACAADAVHMLSRV